VYPVFSQLRACFFIAICATLQTLGPFLPPSRSCLCLFDDFAVWNTWLICHTCLPVVAKGLLLEQRPLYLVLTLVLSEMLDVERYVPHRGKLCLSVKVGRFDHLEQSKISILTVTAIGIVMLTVHHNLMVSVWFIQDPGDVLKQTSPDVLSVEECPFSIYQTSDFSHHSLQCIFVNIQTTANRLTANRRTMGIRCKLQQYAAGLSLNRTCKLAVTHFVLTGKYRYITQGFPHLFVIIFLTFPQLQVTAPPEPQPGAIGSKSRWMTGTSSDAPPAGTQLPLRHQIAQCDAAIEATEKMTQNTNLKTVRKTRPSKNIKPNGNRHE
jgi:hypothetical protein